MNDLTKRFIDTYNELLASKKIINKADFANKIGVSSSLITELLKGRTNLGITPLQNAVIAFDLDANFLLTGVSKINRVNESITSVPCRNCELRDKMIMLLEEKIENLQSNNNQPAQAPDFKQTA